MYIHNSLSWEILQKGPNDLELVALSVSSSTVNTVKHCVSVLYRPPSSSVSFFDSLYNTILNLSPHQFSSFVLVGDFNVDFCNTDHPYFYKLNSILQMLSLSQVVGTPTHTCPNGNSSLIDLALVSNTALLHHCSTMPPIANSDHNGLQLSFKWRLSGRQAQQPCLLYTSPSPRD